MKQLRELLTAESDNTADLVKKQTEEAATALHAMAIGQKRHGDTMNRVSGCRGGASWTDLIERIPLVCCRRSPRSATQPRSLSSRCAGSSTACSLPWRRSRITNERSPPPPPHVSPPLRM